MDISGSEDEHIDAFHRAAELLKGDENKAVRHILDVAAEKLVTPEIGFPSPGFTKEYRNMRMDAHACGGKQKNSRDVSIYIQKTEVGRIT